MNCAACNDTGYMTVRYENESLGEDFALEWVTPCACKQYGVPYPIMSKSENARIRALGERLMGLE